MRLEALAPGGGPFFIMVGEPQRARLLLVRDRRLVDADAPGALLDALVGIALGPDDLRAMLSGCLAASLDPASARAYGDEWIRVDLAGDGLVYLRRAGAGWVVAAGTYRGLDVQYGDLTGAVPARVRIRTAQDSSAEGAAPHVDLTAEVTQVEINGDLPADRLLTINVPPGTTPMTLDELRRSGPLGQ